MIDQSEGAHERFFSIFITEGQVCVLRTCHCHRLVCFFCEICQNLIFVAKVTSAVSYLRSELEKDGIAVTNFPRKHLFNTDAVIAHRKIELSDFIRCYVLPNWFNPACRAFREFDIKAARTGPPGAQADAIDLRDDDSHRE